MGPLICCIHKRFATRNFSNKILESRSFVVIFARLHLSLPGTPMLKVDNELKTGGKNAISGENEKILF